MNDRYKELKKENNERLSYLSGEYQTLAETYLKKARGYAAKSVDTELEIKKVLEEIDDLSNNHKTFQTNISDINNFIETRISHLTKENKKHYNIVGWIILSLIILGSIAWIIVGRYFARRVKLNAPENFRVIKEEVLGDYVLITLSWDESYLAESYTIYFTSSSGKTSSTYTTKELQYQLRLEKGLQYTVFIKSGGSDNFDDSLPTSITYKCE